MEITEGDLVYIKDRKGFGIVTEKIGNKYYLKVDSCHREILRSEKSLIPFAHHCHQYETAASALEHRQKEISARIEHRIKRLNDIKKQLNLK
jgi:hypothetical protein